MYFRVRPLHRYIEVEGRGNKGVITFPTWLPGSYIIREMERNVVSIEGMRITKNKFWVDETFHYKVYAMSWDQREAVSTRDYVFMNGPAVFPFQEMEEEYCVELEVPEGWKVHTTLTRKGENTFCASNYHEMADSSIQASPHLREYRIDDLHYISTIDELDDEFLKRIGKVVEVEDKVFASVDPSIPSKEYVFYFRYSSTPRGGIEHANSSAIVSGWNSDVKSLIEVFSHEYFHRLNVKYLVPKDLDLNYEVESYTELLWFAEGVTDYLAYKLSWEAGAIDLEEFMRRVGDSIQRLTFKGAEMSLWESSMTTWIKYYRRDENYLNSAISYYDGGLLMGFILDMSLFKKGKRIEDKFREIPRRYTLQDLQRTFSDAEVDLGVVKSQSKEMLSMVKDFVTLEFLDRNKPYVGVTLENRVISFVEEGSPADVAGVSPRDEVLSVNDRPAESLQREISRCDEITLTLSREGRSMNLTLKVGRNPGHSVRVSSNDLSRTWAGKPFAVEVQSKVI